MQVSAFHKQHRGQNAEEAMLEYLKIAQDLEMFGIDYFNVVNAKGSDAILGIDALGINFYSTDDKFNPKVSFPWSEIAKINATKQEFVVSPIIYSANHKAETFFNTLLYCIIFSLDKVRGLEEHKVAQGAREGAQLNEEDEGLRRRQQRNVQEEEDARATRRTANEGAKAACTAHGAMIQPAYPT